MDFTQDKLDKFRIKELHYLHTYCLHPLNLVPDENKIKEIIFCTDSLAFASSQSDDWNWAMEESDIYEYHSFSEKNGSVSIKNLCTQAFNRFCMSGDYRYLFDLMTVFGDRSYCHTLRIYAYDLFQEIERVFAYEVDNIIKNSPLKEDYFKQLKFKDVNHYNIQNFARTHI